MFKRFIAAAALVAALAVPVLAAEFTDEQLEGLAARIESFDAAMKASDMSQVMDVVPPKVLDKIAANFNVTTEQLIEATQQQMDQVLKDVNIVSFGMDLEAAEFLETADGTPYALIPTETVMDMGAAGGKLKASSSTLGLLDGETWYLVRTEDAQQAALLKEVYPAFADVEFPAGSMEPVTE
ncbi:MULTISPECIES: hypothetical protein [unclassified Devosia]|jgi:hypothetical protein|uniref:hypothetical protein n=1 Tax=unclassified Devosia TaxID=196773 RepID=UPI00086970B0|nr:MULTISPECIES: hypothetical protein [unclassified Devosia]MBN9363458.1 hypothetical protein [Devosia sp.]ODS95042.1 MAG: hypothetical protein ABS47_04430 [Devosia sp. SCN 66-27]OJX25276.1 MAG: hypothetical protein BGO83_10455 [Devosia sp. 66-14]